MIWLWITLGVLFVFALLAYIASDFFFRKFFVRVKNFDEHEKSNYEYMRSHGQSDAADRILEGRKYLDSLEYEDVSIKSYDGLALRARYIKSGDSRRTVVMVHGYNSIGDHDFSCAFELYRSFGLNLLLIDQRAHGKSEGKYICFGVRERYDVRDWCRFLVERDPGCEIVISGISMGCTTALLAAALPDMPSNLVGVIADCGYTSPYDEFVHVMKDSLRLPRFPFLNIASAICRHRAGWQFSEVSTLDEVKKLKIPVIFIHGEADDFVLPENSKLNYEACGSESKKLLLVPNAGHGLSFLVDEERLRQELREFIERL